LTCDCKGTEMLLYRASLFYFFFSKAFFSRLKGLVINFFMKNIYALCLELTNETFSA